MKLAEALEIVNRSAGGAHACYFLACGFEPLHLRTFLAAHLVGRLPGRGVRIETGQFGSLEENLRRASASQTGAAVVCVEWADLDPRLDLRRLGGWQPDRLDEVLNAAGPACDRLLDALLDLAGTKPVALSLPTLPLPPVSPHARAQAGTFETTLRSLVATLGVRAAAVRGLRLVNGHSLDCSSPPASRLDVRAVLASGFPFTIAHASELARHIAQLLQPDAPKKALVTDLDGTLWKGILGEDGADALSWDLDSKSQVHGLYQQTLAALAESGVLIGVVSKNDPELTRAALARTDLLIAADRIFPVEAGWGLKSEAVARTLATWNIGAESVVMVDDSPWELAEVQQAFPQLECLHFPAEDPDAAHALLHRLRDSFGKAEVLPEDRIRAQSLRAGVQTRQAQGFGQASEALLREAQSEIVFESTPPRDSRALDLVNKTNQFNLNGRRLTQAELAAMLARPGAVILVASYKDRFGSLGRIAVLLGQVAGKALRVDAWVLSCRAFGRQVEHAVLGHLFERLGIARIDFDVQESARNAPVREFLAGVIADGSATLSREQFERVKPALFHAVREVA